MQLEEVQDAPATTDRGTDILGAVLRAHTGAHTYAHTIAMLVSNASRLGEVGAHTLRPSIHTQTLTRPLVHRVLSGSCHEPHSTSQRINFRQNALFPTPHPQVQC